MRVDHGDVPEGAVFAGVDTHADAHWLCVLDAVGRPLLSERFPATPDGYDALAAAVRRAGEPVESESAPDPLTRGLPFRHDFRNGETEAEKWDIRRRSTRRSSSSRR